MSSVHSMPAAAVGGGRARLSRARAATAVPRAAIALTWALLLLLLYAAYDHGAAGLAAGARIQVIVAVLAGAATVGLVWTGTLRFAAPRRAIIATALLVAFAAWSVITLAWSVAPDQTWIEFNRVLTYVLVLALAITAGASYVGSVELVARGFLLVALAVAVYGLGQKLIPGLHVAGIFNLNQTGGFARLQEPLGYWNALALLLAMAVPIALAITVDRSAPRRTRLLALLSTELLLLTIALTYSRGGLLALAVGVAAGMALSGARLRSLMWVGLAVAATVAPLVMGLVDHDLTTSLVPLGSRETAGAELGAVLVVSLAVLWFAGSRLLLLESRSRIGPERARRLGHLVVLLAGIVLACGVIGVAFSSRGLTGTVSHAWDSFTATKGTSVSNPDRLLSVDSENRWVWWKEAVGAFSGRPIGGWGAGSFAVIHLLYRRNTLSVTQAHSVPLQFLGETGLIGAALAIGAYGLLLVTGVKAVRRRPNGTGRLLSAALVAGAGMYALHSFYDWDWNIPGVTLPALAFLGVLAGAAARRQSEKQAGRFAPAGADAGIGLGAGSRVLTLGAIAIALCTVALSGALPSLAAGEANAALLTAARATPTALASAQASAKIASSLDPLSDAGLLVEASIARERDQFRLSRSYLIDAIRRDPTDGQAWTQLAFAEQDLGDPAAQLGAARHVLALDPQGAIAREIVDEAELDQAPPARSVTAIPTPGVR
jgi:hypothetical protein